MNTSIVVCGNKFDIGTQVVLWNELNGLNGYNTNTVITKTQNRKTGKTIITSISGKRYSDRSIISPDLSRLKKIITQFFLHHSGMYHSRDTFNVLHNERKLSVHFILDDDGTIFQTLDLKEKAWHGGNNNPMSIGIEIDSRAIAGKFPDAYDEYHQKKYNVGPRKTKKDKVNGEIVLGYEYTDKQYFSLIKLAIALKQIFPLMSPNGICDFPRTKSGTLIKSVLPNPQKHCGFICHYNASPSKIDPVSFDHDRFLLGVNNTEIVSSMVSNWIERQIFLKDLGFDPGSIDGVFGPKTKKALLDFQLANGIIQDGVWANEEENILKSLGR